MSDDPRGRRVVFVGRRRGALAAAARLGLEVLLVAERPRLRPPVVACHAWRPQQPESALDAADTFGPLAPVAAVLALTEGSVAPAAALRRRLGLPGLTPAAAARCTDKQLMKDAIRAAGLPCAAYATAEEGLDRAALVARLGLPIFLKDRVGSGGRGTRRVTRAAELPDAVCPGRLAEAALDGEELSIEALVAGGRRLFTNPTEYLLPGYASIVPRATSEATGRALGELLDRALPALGIERGVVHMEVFLTADGAVFGELAARPPGGYLLRLIELAYGFDLWEAWLRVELGRPPDGLPAAAARAAGARLFHPGAGILRSVRGERQAADLPGVVELAVRRRPGDVIPPRLGVSQEVAHLIVTGDDRDAVAETLLRAGELLRFELAPG